MVERGFKNLRTKNKLILSFTLMLLLIMVFIYAYFPQKQKQYAYKEMIERLTTLAKSASLAYKLGRYKNNFPAMNDIFTWVKQDPNFAYFHIFDENMEHFFSYPDHLKGVLDSQLEYYKPVERENCIEIKVPVLKSEEGGVLGCVVLGLNLGNLKKTVKKINMVNTIVLIVMFIVGFFISLFLSSLINKPLKALLNSINNIIDSRQYSERVTCNSTDEIGILSARFNEMIRLIEERDYELNQIIEELKRINRLKDDFLAVTTHDLRSPLTAILGFADLISLNDYIKEDDKKRLHYIQRSAEFLSTLVNDILEISRLESEKTALKFRPLLLEGVVESSVNTLQYMALPKDITIDVTNYAAGNNRINGNFDALLRVMNNLISNAVKFTHRKGRIEVKLEPGNHKNEETVKLTVIDTGIGIPEDKIPHLFDTYTKTSQCGTDGEKGTGLGLAITKKIVEKHDGTLTVSSQVGQGSCFTITLPLISSNVSMEKNLKSHIPQDIGSN